MTDVHALPIRVSPQSASALLTLNAGLANVADEFQIQCVPEAASASVICDWVVQDVSITPIVEEWIAHPIDPEVIFAYRITKGSPAFRAALYQATGFFSETKIFSENVLERRLELENSKFRIRCIQDRSNPKDLYHHCWLIVGTSLFAEEIE